MHYSNIFLSKKKAQLWLLGCSPYGHPRSPLLHVRFPQPRQRAVAKVRDRHARPDLVQVQHDPAEERPPPLLAVQPPGLPHHPARRQRRGLHGPLHRVQRVRQKLRYARRDENHR